MHWDLSNSSRKRTRVIVNQKLKQHEEVEVAMCERATPAIVRRCPAAFQSLGTCQKPRSR